MPDSEKRLIRELKRVIKKRGNKVRRADLKRSLAADPEAAADDSGEVTRYNSAGLNGHDQDATRKRE